MLDELVGLLPAFAERDASDPENYPSGSVAELHAAGILRAPLAAGLGGQGCSLLESVQAIQAIAGASPSLALIASMPLGLAGLYGLGAEAAPPEHRAAWCAQTEEIAAAYRAGELYAACNSEKGAGGSLAATKTVARRQADGGFALSGEKILASSGRFADHFFSTAKVGPEELDGAGIVEFFFVDTRAAGVSILEDWDGFGMRSTESQTVRYVDAPAEALMGFPNFIEQVQPLQYFYCLFAAISLGCAGAMLRELANPVPAAPGLRLRFAEATMRFEALEAYLYQTTLGWRAAAGPAFAARVLRMKTHVTQESTRLCAELFALSGGRHYRRTGRLARLLADSFAGTALRPPLPLAIETLSETFALEV
jgi:alkylation response protein AidB-like acyl-CoA dehydrogenase